MTPLCLLSHMEAQQESIAALEAEIRELQASLQRKKDELHSLKQSTVVIH